MSFQDILVLLRGVYPHQSPSDLDRYAIEVHAYLSKVPDCLLNVDTLRNILHTHLPGFEEPQQACDVDLTKGNMDRGKQESLQVKPLDKARQDAELVKREAHFELVSMTIKKAEKARQLEWNEIRKKANFKDIRKDLLNKHREQESAECRELRKAEDAIHDCR
jgi:hypothetical protein